MMTLLKFYVFVILNLFFVENHVLESGENSYGCDDLGADN